MTIRRAPRPESHFTQIHNETLRDARLSYRARGILAAILSYPDDWTTTSESLAAQGAEGREAIRTALADLEKLGYVERTKKQDALGHWSTEMVVFDRPTVPVQTKAALDGEHAATGDGFPGVGQPMTGKPTVGKLGPIKNTVKNTPLPSVVPPAPVEDSTAAGVLVGEWIEACGGVRPPARVIGQVSREVKALLLEGFTPELVRDGMQAWFRKSLNPSALASVVYELQQPRRASVADRQGDILRQEMERARTADAAPVGIFELEGLA